MVSKKVLKNIGVFAMAVMVATTPVLAANATAGTPMATSTTGTNDPVTVDPKPSAQPSVPSAQPSVSEGAEESDNGPAIENRVVVTASGQTFASTVGGVYTVTVVDGIAVTTPSAAVSAAFGTDAAGVSMLAINTDHGPLAEASINHGMAQLANDRVAATKGPVVDVYAYAWGNKVIDITNPITIAVGIPESFQQAGYDYAVVRVQEGGRVSILTDKDSDPSTLTFETNGFGVFAIVKAPVGSFNKYK